MTWSAESAHRRAIQLAVCVALVTVAQAAADVTNAPVPATAGAEGVPAWLNVSALATNAVEWKDMADVWRQNPEANGSPVENLTLPIEHYDNGRIRAVLHASKAIVGSSGLVWSWALAVDMFDPNGTPDGRIEADSCLYDRNARRGYCPAAVALIRTNATITGCGMYWTTTTQRMRILSNAVVRLRQNITLTGKSADAIKAPPDRNLSEGGTTK